MKHRFHPEARYEYGKQVQHYEGRRRLMPASSDVIGLLRGH